MKKIATFAVEFFHTLGLILVLTAGRMGG